MIGRNVWYVGCSCKMRTSVLRRAGGYRRYAKRKTLETTVAISEVLIPSTQRQKEKTHRLVCLSFCGCGRKIRTSALRRAGGYRGYAKRKTCENAAAISEVLIPNSRPSGYEHV